MSTPLPTGPAQTLDVAAPDLHALDLHAMDVRADELGWVLSLDPAVFAVLGGLGLLLLLVTVLAGWLVVRRVRRSALVARARELGAQGATAATAVAARSLPPGPRRTAAELQLDIARARDRLRRQVATAGAAGAHLGDVPGLLPSLEAEGARLEQLLRQRALAPGPADRSDLEADARRYLDVVADAGEAVLEAERAVTATGRRTSEVADAVDALRAHTAAYRELTAPPTGPALPPAPPPPAGPARAT
jgi:hypothetical protein